jgi:NADPH-dependent 7-cyano-7-deazaguanine reductase QueF-like protein
MANKMTGDMQQLNWTINSVANSCENLMIEKTFKRTREQFNQTALHRPDVSKATLCRFLANCCGFLFSYGGQIDHLHGEVDGQHG